MFRIHTIDNTSCYAKGAQLTFTIAGCPTKGTAAIDFRRKHGLPDDTTDRINLTLDLVSESICRQFPEWLYSDANLTLCTNYNSGSGWAANGFDGLRLRLDDKARTLPPDILAAVVKEPKSDAAVLALLTTLRQRIAELKAEADQAAAEQAEKAKVEAAQKRAEAVRWLATADPATLIERRHSTDYTPYFYMDRIASSIRSALTNEEIAALKAAAEFQIEADKAEFWAKLTPHLTETEHEMHARGVLCPKRVFQRLNVATQYAAQAAIGSGVTRIENHEAKECPPTAWFQYLRTIEAKLGLQGTVDKGNQDYRVGYAFTLTTPDGRKLDVVHYRHDDKIEKEDDDD